MFDEYTFLLTLGAGIIHLLVGPEWPWSIVAAKALIVVSIAAQLVFLLFIAVNIFLRNDATPVTFPSHHRPGLNPFYNPFAKRPTSSSSSNSSSSAASAEAAAAALTDGSDSAAAAAAPTVATPAGYVTVSTRDYDLMRLTQSFKQLVLTFLAAQFAAVSLLSSRLPLIAAAVLTLGRFVYHPLFVTHVVRRGAVKRPWVPKPFDFNDWVRDMKKEMKDARRMMASGNYSAAFTGGSADSGSGSGSAGAGGGAQSKAERLRRARVGK